MDRGAWWATVYGVSKNQTRLSDKNFHFTFQFSRGGRPEAVALKPCADNRAQQEEERSLFFPGKDSANDKSWTLCLLEPSHCPSYPLYYIEAQLIYSQCYFSFRCTT